MMMATRRKIRYEDFALELRHEEDGYRVRVRAPFHGPESSFQPPFDPAETERLMAALERRVRRSGPGLARDLAAAGAEEDTLPAAAEVGEALFQSLFPGPVLESFLVRWGQTGAREGHGLRIRLLLDPSRPELAVLCSLPWELLYRGEFLSRDVLTPVVRCLDSRSPWPGIPAPPGDRLRVLVAMASPPGYAPLDLPRERRRIEAAWGRLTAVEVAFVEGATLGGLRRELRDNPFHVLHFMGHGARDGTSGEGLLLFADAQGGADPVSGAMLAETCRGHRGLRLVFLNACDTGRLPRHLGQDPFTGAASALVMGGAPAVVAMQFPISDQAAIAFSGAVYAALAAGDPIDAAVAEGRLAVYQSFPASLEWATPVLFLSTSEGVVNEQAGQRERRWRPGAAVAAAVVVVLLALAGVLWVLHLRAEAGRARFSLGSSLAMVGQSSSSVGRPLFEVALQRLGFPAGETAGLCREYEQIEAARREGRTGALELEENRKRLLDKLAAEVETMTGREAAREVQLGHDLSHLFLVLSHWTRLAAEGDPLPVARGDLAAIGAAARQIQLPGGARDELAALTSRDLARPAERAAALRHLRRILNLVSQPAL